MEDRIELRVMGISVGEIRQGAYALILAEVHGPRRIPVVIGVPEAQSIAIKLEGVRPPRPISHDLFESFAHAFGVTLRDVFIYKFEDGIFYSELTFTDGERTVVLDSRTSDAIAIAMRTKSPIFTTEEILRTTGFVMEIQEEQPAPDAEIEQAFGTGDSSPSIEDFTIAELEEYLARLIDLEDYEEAKRVSELLAHKRQSSGTKDFEL
ncbi:MAG: bifunctional nuclease family protein [Muribaculaceae bacterium]|nr:bifunctional nuclease family protein [Muribaculaceae bacterium]